MIDWFIFLDQPSRDLSSSDRKNGSRRRLGSSGRSSDPDPDPGGRAGSRGSKTSVRSVQSSAPSTRTYYFGEQPEAVNGGAGRDLLNTSLEGATPHKGEVVRIKVPFQEGGEGEEVQREDKEISPRYNGHRVTIQVPRYKKIGLDGLWMVGWFVNYLIGRWFNWFADL